MYIFTIRIKGGGGGGGGGNNNISKLVNSHDPRVFTVTICSHMQLYGIIFVSIKMNVTL